MWRVDVGRARACTKGILLEMSVGVSSFWWWLLLWSRRAWAGFVTSTLCLGYRCFEGSHARLGHLGQSSAVPCLAHVAAVLREPCDSLSSNPTHRCGPVPDLGPNPMPIARLLRRAPLYPSPPSRYLAFISSSSLSLSCARNMATKPSLAAAEDFLSFVNASPTRMRLQVARRSIFADLCSLPCCQVSQREAREGWL